MDLVISDIYMPVLDGIRFHRKVRSNPEFARLPFLFVSAFDDQHTLDAVQDPRCEGFLRKARPVSEMKEWIQYLTTPEEKRPKMPPGGARSRLNDQLAAVRAEQVAVLTTDTTINNRPNSLCLILFVRPRHSSPERTVRWVMA